MSDEQPPPSRPLLRVVRGDASAEEVAALVAVLTARGADAPAPSRPRGQWSHPGRALRAAPSPSAGGWRASALP